MKIASWNVNGIRACHRNGFLDWLRTARCDVVLLQEIRALEEQVPEEVASYGRYQKAWLPAKIKKGYSGVAILSKEEPKKLIEGIGTKKFDDEGRVLTAEFKDHIIVSAYFPNSQEKGKRIEYKVGFCKSLHTFLEKQRKKGKPVILGGDLNIAHQPIDLAHPEQNEENPGYLPEERDWMGSFLESGWIDTFRTLHPRTERYSWWSMRFGARERNVGWRIDYQVVHEKDRDRVRKADILTDVLGSDHCPVTLDIDIG